MKGKLAVCLVSGGLDSTIVAAIAKEQGYDLNFLFLRYGQRTSIKEENCLDKVSKFLGVKKIWKIDIPWLTEFSKSIIFDENILQNEIDQYVEIIPNTSDRETSINIKKQQNNHTVIKTKPKMRLVCMPFRNSIFLSIAGALAETIGAEAIFIGSSGSDICPDNSSEYLALFQKVIDQGAKFRKGIKIIAPLINANKIDTVKIGIQLKVPFGLTWSCHNNVNVACRYCNSCKERLNAFKSNGIDDPIKYAEQN